MVLKQSQLQVYIDFVVLAVLINRVAWRWILSPSTQHCFTRSALIRELLRSELTYLLTYLLYVRARFMSAVGGSVGAQCTVHAGPPGGHCRVWRAGWSEWVVCVVVDAVYFTRMDTSPRRDRGRCPSVRPDHGLLSAICSDEAIMNDVHYLRSATDHVERQRSARSLDEIPAARRTPCVSRNIGDPRTVTESFIHHKVSTTYTVNS